MKNVGVETRVGDVFTFTIKQRLYFKVVVSSIMSQVSDHYSAVKYLSFYCNYGNADNYGNPLLCHGNSRSYQFHSYQTDIDVNNT